MKDLENNFLFWIKGGSLQFYGFPYVCPSSKLSQDYYIYAHASTKEKAQNSNDCSAVSAVHEAGIFLSSSSLQFTTPILPNQQKYFLKKASPSFAQTALWEFVGLLALFIRDPLWIALSNKAHKDLNIFTTAGHLHIPKSIYNNCWFYPLEIAIWSLPITGWDMNWSAAKIYPREGRDQNTCCCFSFVVWLMYTGKGIQFCLLMALWTKEWLEWNHVKEDGGIGQNWKTFHSGHSDNTSKIHLNTGYSVSQSNSLQLLKYYTVGVI